MDFLTNFPTYAHVKPFSCQPLKITQLLKLCIIYIGNLVSVLRIGVHVWCLHKKGPVYVAIFKPLGIAIVMVMVVTFLGETRHLAIATLFSSLLYYGADSWWLVTFFFLMLIAV